LFGSQAQEGSLVISDGLFEKTAQQMIRPRLRIDGASGTAAKGGKFDVAHLAKGESFRFSITWKGHCADCDEIQTVEQMLAALHIGEIRLGAQKSNGFGLVKLSVKKRIYNLKNAGDRNAWLADSDDGTDYELPGLAHSGSVLFTVRGQMDSVLIKSGALLQQEKGSVAVNIEENGTALIPGSSVKGAVRARAQAIASHLGISQQTVEEIFGRGAQTGDQHDNGIAGKVRFSDVTLEKGKKQRITRIRLDGFTGGVMRGGKFSEEPLCSHVTMRIVVPNDPVACRLMLYALRDLGFGLYGLGSGGSIGRGYLSKAQIIIAAPEGRKATMSFAENHQVILKDDKGMVKEWLNRKEGEQA